MRAPATLCALCLSAAAIADAEPREPEPPLAVAITVTGSLGWVDMGQFNDGVSSYFTQLDSQVDGFEASPEASHLATALGVRVQLRLPRFITVESGFDYLSQGESTPISIGASDGEISYRNHAVSIPLLLGAHVPVADRLAVGGGIGPVLIIAGRSRWDYTFGQVSSFIGKLGGGLEAAVGAEAVVWWRLRAAATLRYRFAKSGDLRADGAELPPLQPVLELGWTGVAGELGLRIVFD